MPTSALSRFRQYTKRRLFGTRFPHYCNLCEQQLRFGAFGAPPREHAQCPQCGSLERHRFVWRYFALKTGLLNAGTARFLHIAPEPALASRLRPLLGASYASIDLSSDQAMVHSDFSRRFRSGPARSTSSIAVTSSSTWSMTERRCTNAVASCGRAGADSSSCRSPSRARRKIPASRIQRSAHGCSANTITCVPTDRTSAIAFATRASPWRWSSHRQCFRRASTWACRQPSGPCSSARRSRGSHG